MRQLVLSIGGVLAILASNVCGQEASFTPIELSYASVNAVSADGRTVVGSQGEVFHAKHAYKWSLDGGLVVIGRFGFNAGAADVSADGSVVVGSGYINPTNTGAIRWTPIFGPATAPAYWDLSADTCLGLHDADPPEPVFPNPTGPFNLVGDIKPTRAFGVSADGSIVVGQADVFGVGTRAFIWTTDSGEAVTLGTLGGTLSIARAVSADGLTIVGDSTNASGQSRVFIWEAGVMSEIPSLGSISNAYDVSPNGSMVVGWSKNAADVYEAFVWTEETGTIGIGMDSTFSQAVGVSDNGRVVGQASGGTLEGPFVWDAVNGIQLIEDILTDNGVDLTGYTLGSAQDISDDGTVVVGMAYGPNGSRPYIATVPMDVTPLTPSELLIELIEHVADINLHHGISNALDAKLNNALDAFIAENVDQRQDAVNKLEAFINAVEAQRNSKISDADATYLVEAANYIIVVALQ